jgi:hypothetical protein
LSFVIKSASHFALILADEKWSFVDLLSEIRRVRVQLPELLVKEQNNVSHSIPFPAHAVMQLSTILLTVG